MKYIDAEKLRGEIERREKIIRNSANQISDSEKKIYYSGCADALLELLPFITSLQREQPEVDLENEINKVWDNGLSDELAGPHNNFDICARLARHFFELGRVRNEQPEGGCSEKPNDLLSKM